MIKLLTFQHKEVWNEIQQKGIYRCTKKLGYHIDSPIIYRHAWEAIPNKSQDYRRCPSYPIFCWYEVFNSLIQIDRETISRCLEMVPFNIENYILLEIEIPKNKVNIHNFYDFASFRLDEIEDISLPIERLKKLFTTVNQEEKQAVIEYITKDYILNIYTLKQYKILKVNPFLNKEVEHFEYDIDECIYSKEKV